MNLLDRVTKTYGKKGPALDRINLHVENKEFVIIVGQSGAGKSTLLKLLTREEKPTSGKIIVGGIDYEQLRDKDIPYLRRKIGTVFQDFKLLPNRTVAENIAFALEIVGMSNRQIKIGSVSTTFTGKLVICVQFATDVKLCVIVLMLRMV